MGKLRDFFRENRGQALMETIIFVMLVYIFIAVFCIHIGLIQLVRERLEIANNYYNYTKEAAKSPDSGRALTEKTKLLLKHGAPSIDTEQPWIERVDVGGGRVSAVYRFNSSIMEEIVKKDKMTLSPHKMKIRGPQKK